MLEEIVKKYVPFTGVYGSTGFDKKGRITLPKPLVEILKRRQQVFEKGELELFYKLHIEEQSKYIELTDYFPKKAKVDFRNYGHLSKIDEGNRILIPMEELGHGGINNGNPVIFIGNGHKILVYHSEYYKKFIQPTL